jgi:hypothetical protein
VAPHASCIVTGGDPEVRAQAADRVTDDRGRTLVP